MVPLSCSALTRGEAVTTCGSSNHPAQIAQSLVQAPESTNDLGAEIMRSDTWDLNLWKEVPESIDVSARLPTSTDSGPKRQLLRFGRTNRS